MSCHLAIARVANRAAVSCLSDQHEQKNRAHEKYFFRATTMIATTLRERAALHAKHCATRRASSLTNCERTTLQSPNAHSRRSSQTVSLFDDRFLASAKTAKNRANIHRYLPRMFLARAQVKTKSVNSRVRCSQREDVAWHHFCALRDHFARQLSVRDDDARTSATASFVAAREAKTCSMLCACARIPLDVLLSTRNIITNSRGKDVDEKVNDT
jgi:hypothetical protein